MNKKGGFGYILAIVLMVFITVKLIATTFRPVALEFKNLLIITNEQTIHIDENN
jgi:hypothetical protein